MSRKKIIWSIILLVAIAGGWYGYKEYTRTHSDLQKVKADFVLPATDLIREFETNDSLASKKYNGKVVEINGFVKKVEKDEQGFYTIVLGDSSSLSSVRCSMDTVHTTDAAGLKEFTSAIVRGICTGFNKDDMGLGSDVILNRGAVITKKD